MTITPPSGSLKGKVSGGPTWLWPIDIMPLPPGHLCHSKRKSCFALLLQVDSIARAVPCFAAPMRLTCNWPTLTSLAFLSGPWHAIEGLPSTDLRGREAAGYKFHVLAGRTGQKRKTQPFFHHAAGSGLSTD